MKLYFISNNNILIQWVKLCGAVIYAGSLNAKMLAFHVLCFVAMFGGVSRKTWHLLEEMSATNMEAANMPVDTLYFVKEHIYVFRNGFTCTLCELPLVTMQDLLEIYR